MDALQALRVYTPANPKRRLGRDYDGGYVVVDGLSYDLYLSCGIGDDTSFDQAFCELHDVPSFAFDGTVARPHHLPARMGFYRKNIGPRLTQDTDNLWRFLDGGRFRDIFLKIDIEGGEWHWLKCLEARQLKCFRQIVIEFHGVLDDSWGACSRLKREVLAKLAETHRAVHVHGNNHGPMANVEGHDVPHVLEVTYLRNDEAVEGLNTAPFPSQGLDFFNYHGGEEMRLTGFPFVDAAR